jgi:hypothetical protein
MDDNIRILASQYLEMFERLNRSDGISTWKVRDDVENDQLRQLIHDAHEEMFPDDYKYNFIVDALSMIADGCDIDDPLIEYDVYYNQLIWWLASHSDRIWYCNEYGMYHDNIMSIIQSGQFHERLDVFLSVVNSLKNILDHEN